MRGNPALKKPTISANESDMDTMENTAEIPVVAAAYIPAKKPLGAWGVIRRIIAVLIGIAIPVAGFMLGLSLLTS